jgi:hypothetical protein
MTQVALAVLSVVGALTGVGLGAMLTARSQRVAWERQEAGKSLQERRTSYAAFIAAAREWRAAVMSPDAAILEASSVSRKPHADGGEARTRFLRLRAELALAAHAPETVRAADLLVDAVAHLAEARAGYPLGQVPEPIVQACRDADRDFLHAARAELGSPWIDLKALDRSRRK